MEEVSMMNYSMTNTVRDVIAGAHYNYQHKGERADYISNRMKETFPNINWGVIIYKSDEGYSTFKNSSTNYYYGCKRDGNKIIIIGFSKESK